MLPRLPAAWNLRLEIRDSEITRLHIANALKPKKSLLYPC